MGSYQQVLAGTSLNPFETFSNENGPIDVDSGVPTLTLTRPDGTAFTPVPTVTHLGAAGSGQYQFQLQPQPDPYFLDYALAGPVGGITQTLKGRVEWIGEYLFNLADLRGLKVAGGTPFSDTNAYPNKALQDTRAAVRQEFEEILGYSPVPRFYREVHSVGSWAQVGLRQLKFQRLLTLKVSGVAQTVGNFYVDPGGTLLPVTNYLAGYWSAYGYGNLAVEYVAGLDRPPGKGSYFAMLYAASQLNPAGFSSATTVSLPTGESFSYEPSEVGRSGFQRFTGIRDVDRWLNLHAQRGLAVA